MSIIKNSRTYGVETKFVGATTETLEVTENGTYTPSAGVDGFSSVVVNCEGPQYDTLVFTNTSGETNTLSVYLANMELKNANYSLDEGSTWTTFDSDDDGWTTGTDTVTIEFTDKLYFRWQNIYNKNAYKHLCCSKTYTLNGDLYLNSGYQYQYLFYDDRCLTEANELVFHNTIVGPYWGYRMFYNCYALTKAPSLPATTVPDYAYDEMFFGCISLTTAPELPATTLGKWCYYGMFANCIITTAPELPATTVPDYAYDEMFRNCPNLTQAPELPATTIGRECYKDMFKDCTSLTTAPTILPATTLNYSTYNGMFRNCSNLTQAPELPATSLIPNCYNYMFYGCSNLNYIKAMFTTTPSTSYTRDWVSGVASTGTFVKNSAATWEDVFGTSAIPSGWTVETADA